MEDSVFSDGFHFKNIEFHRYHYTDSRRGAGSHYFGCLREGWARLTDGAAEITVYPGELFYIPRGCRYQSYWYSEDKVRFLSMGFKMYPNPARRSYRLQKIECTPEEREVLEYFMYQPRQPDSLSIGRLYTLMGLVAEHMTVELIDRQSEIVERAMLYMNRHTHVCADEIAAYCGISVSTLYQTFRKHTGKTPGDIWHEVQIHKAIELLTATDLPVEEISDRLGFSSSSYFRKIFRAQTGKTPREVRKSSPYFTDLSR